MKKSITAIILVFAMLTGLAACRKLENEGQFVIESKVYVVDDSGNQHNVESVVKDNGETEYYYYDTQGNKVTVAHKDVVIETTKIYKPAPTTMSPEMQSFFEAYSDPDSFQQLVEEDVTQPKLSISEDLISENDFVLDKTVELGADGRPVRGDDSYAEIFMGDSFTADFVVKSDYNGQKASVPFYITKDSKNMYIKATMPVENGGMKMEFLILDKECYVVIPAMRAYVKMSAEDMSDLIPDEAINQEMTDTYVKSGKVKVGGVVYDCDVYTAEGQTIKYYYKDDVLKRVESTTGDDDAASSIVEYNTIKEGADKSKFKVPTGYMDMTSMMGSNFDLNALG